jgi:hypothetical protein
MFVRRSVFVAPLLVLSAACQLVTVGGPKSGSSKSPSAESASVEGSKDKADDKGAADAVTTGLPATAAHASIAWFVGRMDDVPDAPLGGTAQTKVDGAKAGGFIAEIAIGNVAPSVLKTRRMPKTAKVLEAVKAITDAKSLSEAKTLVADAKKVAKDELATIPDSGDRSNSETQSTRIFEALDDMLAKLEPQMTATNAPIRDRSLASWAAILEGANDDTAIEMIQRDLPLYVTLLKTGTAPKRTTKTAPRYLHPAIRYYLRGVAGYGIEMAAPVLGMDVTDTLRGKNVDVHLVAADVALRELAPLVLESCNDKTDAAKLRTLPKIKDEATLQADTDAFGNMQGYSGSPNYGCLEMALNATTSTSEAIKAFEFQKKKINDHPYYARSAITGWVQAFSWLRGHGTSDDAVRGMMMKDLEGFAAKLRAMPRRKEVEREPKG